MEIDCYWFLLTERQAAEDEDEDEDEEKEEKERRRIRREGVNDEETMRDELFFCVCVYVVLTGWERHRSYVN